MPGESVALPEAPEVYQPAYSRFPCGLGEPLGAHAIVLRVVLGRGHRVDQVVRGMHAAKGVGERAGLHHVTRQDFGAVGYPRAEMLRPAGHAAERAPVRLERMAQPAPDVAARAGEEGEPAPGAHSTSSAPSRRSTARNSANDAISRAPAAFASTSTPGVPAPPTSNATPSGRPVRISLSAERRSA